MKKVLVSYQPFAFTQYILIVDNDNIVEKIDTNMEKVNMDAAAAAQKYNVDEILLCGNTSYMQNFKKEIEHSLDMTKYKNIKVTIND